MGCSFGKQTPDQRRLARRLPRQRGADHLRRLLRGPRRLPPYAFDGTPIATIKLFGTRVTVTDHSAPACESAARCSRAAGAGGSDQVAYNATDNARHPRGSSRHRWAAPRVTPLPVITASRHRAPMSRRSIGVPADMPDGTHRGAGRGHRRRREQDVRAPRDQGRRHAAHGRPRTRQGSHDRHVGRGPRLWCRERHARGPEQLK